MKRSFDILFSIGVLVFLAPVLLLIAPLIRLSSRGGVFYTQIRLGQSGKVFKCYKFRTMYVDADRRLAKILDENPVLRTEWEQNQKLRLDPRIFPLGHLLRKTSIDELPQFWNVLKGDLSVVGPRPYMVRQRSDIAPLAYKILSIRPGITGLWQTSGRSTTTFQTRMELDAKYVDTRSFWLDVRLICKTLPEILFSKNAC